MPNYQSAFLDSRECIARPAFELAEQTSCSAGTFKSFQLDGVDRR